MDCACLPFFSRSVWALKHWMSCIEWSQWIQYISCFMDRTQSHGDICCSRSFIWRMRCVWVEGWAQAEPVPSAGPESQPDRGRRHGTAQHSTASQWPGERGGGGEWVSHLITDFVISLHGKHASSVNTDCLNATSLTSVHQHINQSDSLWISEVNDSRQWMNQNHVCFSTLSQKQKVDCAEERETYVCVNSKPVLFLNRITGIVCGTGQNWGTVSEPCCSHNPAASANPPEASPSSSPAHQRSRERRDWHVERAAARRWYHSHESSPPQPICGGFPWGGLKEHVY